MPAKRRPAKGQGPASMSACDDLDPLGAGEVADALQVDVDPATAWPRARKWRRWRPLPQARSSTGAVFGTSGAKRATHAETGGICGIGGDVRRHFLCGPGRTIV